MSEILLTGSLEQIRAGVVWMQATIQMRATEGYPLLQPDEEWVYTTVDDDRVCPVCGGYHRRVFRGDEIPAAFPSFEIVYAGTDGARILPNVHVDNPELLGECRCTLDLLYIGDILTERLYQEFVEAVSLI